MRIYYDDKYIDLNVDDESHCLCDYNSHYLDLTFSLGKPLDLPLNAYCFFNNMRYTLMDEEEYVMNNSEDYEYSLRMWDYAHYATMYKMRNPIDGRLEFSYTATPLEHLQMVVANLNMRDPGWSVGECIDAAEQTISYSYNFLNECVDLIATTFNTEKEYVGKVISLRTISYNESNPLVVEYGEGKGILPPVERSNDETGYAIRTVLTQGGSTNIDTSKYGSKSLLLPKSQTIQYDGTCFEGEEGFNEDIAYTYVSSADGLSIQRTGNTLTTYKEEALNCTDIAPKRVGEVTSVDIIENEDGEVDFVDIIDNTIPEALNFANYRIGGTTPTIVFQSGMLSGKTFDLENTATELTGYIHSERRFKIVQQKIDGLIMPNPIEYDGAYMPKKGDKYAIFGVTLPDAYICDNDTKSGSSWDMFRAGVRYLFIHENPLYKYSGTIDKIWAKADWANIGQKLVFGGYIKYVHHKYHPVGVPLRINSIKRYINNPYAPEVDFSNTIMNSGSYAALKATVKATESLLGEQKENANYYNNKLYNSLQSYLRSDIPDTAQGLIRFLKGIEIGEAIDSMLAGKGIVADKNGRLQLSRLEVRESMTINEIIYNRQSAMEGDFIFSEAGTIESIEEVESDTFEVAIRKDYDFDFTALEEGDIVRGVVNNLQSETKEYYTSWCRVLEKDTSANTLTLVQYDDDEVPGGKNYPPTKLMKLNRWGNTTNERRQRVWFISSYDGQIVWLTGVNKPILETWNYASTWGLPPNFLTADGNLPLNPDQPYFYARGAVIQDLIRVDYQGKPLMEIVDRSNWSLEVAQSEDPYLFEEYNKKTMRYESHEVWHNSIKWRCLSSRTTEEPRWNSSDWEALSGNFEMSIETTGGQRFFRGSNVYTTLTATLYNGDADISADVADTQVEWTRVSSKPDEDLAWNILRVGAGLALEITPLDLPSDWLETRQVSYKCSVAIRETTVTNTFNINK